ncbi:hypothetical protein SETIT_1G311800v2 [Setaria italica]|uniref:Uncharacterized protein n=1 Tax=Setaria italica TaxID=4555 RepID=A0A368PTG0_SETIT|nr:hypothetical protein SETIT_1G311800v2 [Setaria italica]
MPASDASRIAPLPFRATRSLASQHNEVEWITRELERLLAREQSGGDAGADGRHRCRKRAKLSPAPKKGGFLADLLGRYAVSICSGDDTVGSSAAAAAGIGRRGRRRGGWGSFREVEKV